MYLNREKNKGKCFIMLKGFHLIISIITITVLTVKCLQSVDTVKPLGTAGLKVSD